MDDGYFNMVNKFQSCQDYFQVTTSNIFTLYTALIEKITELKCTVAGSQVLCEPLQQKSNNFSLNFPFIISQHKQQVD